MNSAKKILKSFTALTIASIKMYFRNITALFFTLFLPIVFILAIGLLGNSSPSIKIDLTNYAHSDLATKFLESIKNAQAFKVSEVSETVAADELAKGKVDLELIIPADFGSIDKNSGELAPAVLKSYYNQGKPQNGQTAGLIINQILSGFSAQISHTAQSD